MKTFLLFPFLLAATSIALGYDSTSNLASLSRTDSESLHESLCKAIEDGDIVAINSYLARGGSPDLRDSDGFSLLMAAAASGQKEIVEKLIQAGADTTLKEGTLGFTALLLALFSDEIEVSKLLIEEGKSVNIRNADSTSPLHVAAGNLSPELVKKLIAKGADPKAVTVQGMTALLPCIEAAALSILPKDKEALEIVRTLIEAGAEVDAQATINGNTIRAIHSAAACGLPDIVQLLLRSGAATDKIKGDTFSPLCAAIVLSGVSETGAIEKIKEHFVQGAKDGQMGRMWQNMSEEEVERYCEELSLGIKSRIGKGLCDSLRVLIYNGADVNSGATLSDGRIFTPLGLAILVNNPQIVRILIAAGADVSRGVQAERNVTPIEMARKVANPEIIKLLEDAGAK